MATSISLIPSSDHKHFQSCIGIYINAFPPGERQPLDRIVARIDAKACELYCYLDNDTPAGIAFIWHFMDSDIMHLDYFAIAAEARGRGYGSDFLHAIYHIAATKRKILALEIEHPHYGGNTAERRARLSFYTSSGAKVLSNVRYLMPSQNGTGDIEMLLLMHSAKPLSISKAEVTTFITSVYTNVYLLPPDHALMTSIISELPVIIEVSDTL